MGGPTSNSARSVTNTNINTSNIQNIKNHQTDFETHVTNQDYLKEVGGDRIGGSVNTFNGIQNAGNQCFGATCLLQELTKDPLSEGLHHLTDGSTINIIGLQELTKDPLSEGLHHLTDGSTINIIGLQELSKPSYKGYL